MFVEMRTSAQAAQVSGLTGWPRLAGRTPGSVSRVLDAGDRFEVGRVAVESVSVLFTLWETDAGGQRVEVSSGWSVTAAKFEVEWPGDRGLVRSHFGARRKAYNWALGRVKADLDARAVDSGHVSVPWTLGDLRKRWNQEKDVVAPWWPSNSKEAYASGISDAVTALGNWSTSKHGARKGRRVGFPRFKSVRKGDLGRVRFTTGALRLEADRRTITLPVIGGLRSKESTRRVQRRVAKGDARVLSMTLSEQWGRLFVAVNYTERTRQARPVTKPGVRAGVDLGLRTLATVADTDGNLIEYPNPAPLRATLVERRKAGRELSRRIPGSNGHRAAKAKLTRLDRRAVCLRRQAWHQLTFDLAGTYGQVVVEDLNLAAMARSMGRRAFRRSVSDAALGMFRPMLAYKTVRAGTVMVVADRWYPSSQTHHGCGCRLAGQTRMAKHLVCAVTGELVDRDHNAAKNLRDWTESTISPGLVEPSAPVDTQAHPTVGTDPGPAPETTPGPGSDHQTRPQGRARRGEAKTNPAQQQGRNPEKGAA